LLANPLTFSDAMDWLAQLQPLFLLGFLVSFIWNVAVCHTQFKHIRKNMATKKDLEVARLKVIADVKAWAEERFVTERECASRIAGLSPGSAHGK